MNTINTLKTAIHPDNLGYSKGHTNLFDDGKTYEFFKLESDGYVYVHCIDTDRYTRYNGEGQNGKRISKDAYLEARKTLDREIEAAKLDAAAENDEISLEQFAELLQEAEISVDTEAGKEIAKEMAPKAKKTRKSKDIAYTYYTDDEHTNALFTLTAKQVDFIKHLPDTCFWENGIESIIWVDCLCDDIGGQFANKPMTVGAMISTLCEKGLGTRATDRKGPRGGKATSFALTEMGQAVAIDLGL